MTPTLPSSADSFAEQEARFLAQLEATDVQTSDLLREAEDMRGLGRAQEAEALAELLQDELAKRQAYHDVLAVLERRVAWRADEPDLWRFARDVADHILQSARERRGLAVHAGFGPDLPVEESLRRLRLLLSLQAGLLCEHPTWGGGVIRALDWFNGGIEIDFTSRKGHRLSAAYAAGSLALLGDDHVLAIRHRNPEQVDEWLRTDPGELARRALQSWGSMTPVQLRERLVPEILPDEEWKSFWERARKALKADPNVEVPSNRTAPLRLVDAAQAADERLQALAQERDLTAILAAVEEELSAPNPTPGWRVVAAERLGFVLRGARPTQPGFRARALMLAARFEAELPEAAEAAREFLSDQALLHALRQMPVRSIRPFWTWLLDGQGEPAIDLVLRELHRLPIAGLAEAVELLRERGREAAVADALRAALSEESAGVDMLSWLIRHPERIESWGLGRRAEVADLMLIVMEQEHHGEQLKVRHQLSERFGRTDWLQSVLEEMDEMQRRQFFLRIRQSHAWPVLDQRSVLARMIKLYSEFGEIQSDVSADSSSSRPRGRITSHRTYRERQEQWEQIVQFELPRVARDTALARSYGDLSENHEYKAARENQDLLLRRRAEIEHMLRDVQPTDFSAAPSDRAGPGTAVRLRYSDGRTERFFILGAWDNEERLGIISCETRMAQALEGRRVGDAVTVPTAQGEAEGVLEEVSALPPEARAWIAGESGTCGTS